MLATTWRASKYVVWSSQATAVCLDCYPRFAHRPVLLLHIHPQDVTRITAITVIDLNTFLDSYYLYVGDPYTTNADFLKGIRFPNKVANDDDDELLDHDVDVECVPFVPQPTTENGAEGDAHQTKQPLF